MGIREWAFMNTRYSMVAMQGDGNGNGDGSPGDRIERLFFETIQRIPLGSLAEQHCLALVRARANGEPITREIMISYIASLGELMRKSQYVEADKELSMELAAAKPFLKRLGAALETSRSEPNRGAR